MDSTQDSLFLSSDSPQGFFGTVNIYSIGLATVISWFGLLLWSPSMLLTLPQELQTDMSLHLCRLSLMAAYLISYIAIRNAPFSKVRSIFTLISFALSTALMAFMSIAGPTIPAWAFACLWFIEGLCTAEMMFTWNYVVKSRAAFGQSVVNMGVSLIFTGCVFLLLSAMQYRIALYVAISLSALSLGLLLVVEASSGVLGLFKRSGASSQASKGKPATPSDLSSACCGANALEASIGEMTSVHALLGKSARSYVVGCGMLLGLAGSIASRFEYCSMSQVVIGCSILAAGALMLYMLRTKAIMHGKMLFSAFPLLAAICVFLFSVETSVAVLSSVFVCFFWCNSSNMLNIAFNKGTCPKADEADRPDSGLAAARFASELRIEDMVGSFIGWAAGTLIASGLVQAFVPYSLLYIVFSALGCMAFSSREGQVPAKGISPGGIVDAQEGDVSASYEKYWARRCEELSKTFGLSPRETEVLSYLARGRDRQFIASKLIISVNTVRTHAYYIYKKMGVKNQQELLDMVQRPKED